MVSSAQKRYRKCQFLMDKEYSSRLHSICTKRLRRLYHCVLLVCTFYTPHVHNLGFLRTQAERIDARLTYVWPRDTRQDRARFEKLKEAYVKARYSKHYRITKEELEWLGEQVEELGRVVHEVCSERLEKLKREANGTH